VSGATFTLNLPAALVPGNLVVAAVTTDNRTLTTPAGWTMLATATNPNGEAESVYEKTVATGDGNTVAVQESAGGSQTVGMAVQLSGDGAQVLIDVVSTATSSGTAVQGSITTSLANERVLAFEGAALYTPNPDSITAEPTGWTKPPKNSHSQPTHTSTGVLRTRVMGSL